VLGVPRWQRRYRFPSWSSALSRAVEAAIRDLARQRVERMPIHKRSRLGLSYLPQEASIFRRLTVAENIRAVLELQYGADGRPLKPTVIEELLGSDARYGGTLRG